MDKKDLQIFSTAPNIVSSGANILKQKTQK